MIDPSHTWNADDRCTACGIGNWVLIAHKPCTRAPLTATTAGDAAPTVDWFALNRSAG